MSIECPTSKTIIKTRKKYDINFYELNTNLQLKESQFLLLLQDIATDNAEINGFGPTFTIKNNFGWFLIKYKIELYENFGKLPYIEIETFPRGALKLFTMREFNIYNPDNKLIGRVLSSWTLVDMNTKKMVSIIKSIPEFPIFQKKVDDLAFNKIKIPETFDYKKEFDVRFDDLDTNHHANNSNFIIWALEALPYDFRLKYSIKSIDIQLKKDISLNETVISKSLINDKETYHVLINKSTNDELSIIKASWG